MSGSLEGCHVVKGCHEIKESIHNLDFMISLFETKLKRDVRGKRDVMKVRGMS